MHEVSANSLISAAECAGNHDSGVSLRVELKAQLGHDRLDLAVPGRAEALLQAFCETLAARHDLMHRRQEDALVLARSVPAGAPDETGAREFDHLGRDLAQ